MFLVKPVQFKLKERANILVRVLDYDSGLDSVPHSAMKTHNLSFIRYYKDESRESSRCAGKKLSEYIEICPVYLDDYNGDQFHPNGLRILSHEGFLFWQMSGNTESY